MGRLLRLVDAKDSWQVFLAPVSLERLPVSLLISWGGVGSEAHLLQPAQSGSPEPSAASAGRQHLFP